MFGWVGGLIDAGIGLDSGAWVQLSCYGQGCICVRWIDVADVC